MIRQGTSRFSFEIDGRRCGDVVFELSDSEFLTETRFAMPGSDEVHRVFEVVFRGLRVERFREAAANWIVVRNRPPLHLPDCALNILLRHAAEGDFRYRRLCSRTGAELDTIDVTVEGGVISETRGDLLFRRFWLREGMLDTVDWGGAISRRLDE